MDIFEEPRNLHPGHDQLIKEHYAKHFDTIFIAFSPFFKIQNSDSPNTIHRAFIGSYDNNYYPKDEEIYESGTSVRWNDIRTLCGFSSFGDINKALKTSIGAYREVFERPDLTEKLWNCTNDNHIFYPSEGHFEVLSKIEIFKAFRLLNKSVIVIEEEFYSRKKEINVTSFDEKQFVDAISFKDYYLYDESRELLFAVDWDDFFFLICSDKQNVDKIVDTLSIEGFYCDETTEATWELTWQEINEGLAKEKH